MSINRLLNEDREVLENNEEERMSGMQRNTLF
jgi:hypothetical protein